MGGNWRKAQGLYPTHKGSRLGGHLAKGWPLYPLLYHAAVSFTFQNKIFRIAKRLIWGIEFYATNVWGAWIVSWVTYTKHSNTQINVRYVFSLKKSLQSTSDKRKINNVTKWTGQISEELKWNGEETRVVAVFVSHLKMRDNIQRLCWGWC